MARRTFGDILNAPSDVDAERLAATDEAEIRRHAREDGHDPDGEIDGYRPVLPARAVRERLNLTQTAFAAALRIPVGTVRNWEQGRTLPDPAARSLLDAVAAEPVAVLKALQSTAAKLRMIPKVERRLDPADQPLVQGAHRDEPTGPFSHAAAQPDQGGRLLFEAAVLQAGEHLRDDLVQGALIPHMDLGGGLSVDSGSLDPTIGSGAVLAARERVRRALDAVGPDMSGLLIDLCGFLKRLERIEAERGWPPQSAQVISRIALTRLADHYGLKREEIDPDSSYVDLWRELA